MLHCHAGCDTKNILAAVGLQEKDMFNNSKKEKPVVVAEYIYRDEEDKPLYKVVKYQPKNFVQAKYENGEWVWKMKDVRYVLYNLSNVIKSDTIYWVEGEKDADNLNKLGLVATTTVGGASNFIKRADNYMPFLSNKKVLILPDNDKPGYKYASDIENALKSIVSEIKILKLADVVDDLKEKEDISDVIQRYGKEKALEIIEKLESSADTVEETAELEFDPDNLMSVELFERLYKFELNDIEEYVKLYNQIKVFCSKNKITGFDRLYNKYKENKQSLVRNNNNGMMLAFPDMNGVVYHSNRYTIDENNFIYEVIPDVGKILVCYHPILPIEKYQNIEDGTEKVKIGFYKNEKWNYMTVEKSIISSSQSIVKLSDFGISVTSENAKHLVKYLAEIENLNKDLIPVSVSTSRLGWIGNDVLIPYSDKYEFDNDREITSIRDRFSESGTLKEWVEFFKEKRKYSSIARITMAAGVASILLKRIKQNGFTVHIWGRSEYGKTVACMIAQSIFGNPSLNDKGIGINFNFTAAGLEYRLNAYNNIPLFINEMQHQKDAKDYDKILFLIAEGKGKSRSTKVGGIARENSWNNVVITNGEKNIIKSNSNAGAYNRCLGFEITQHSYENLPEVVDFAKENYGTVIKEILEHIDEYDCKEIYKKFLDGLKDVDTTDKQKIMVAVLMLADKVLTDIIFKDSYYLTFDDFKDSLISKTETAVEERALEVIKDWYVSEKRHFFDRKDDDTVEERIELYGKKLQDGYVAFIPSILKDKLNNNGFDGDEVINAWKRKDYLKFDKNRNCKNVRFGSSTAKCIVVNLKLKDDDMDIEKDEEGFPVLPF